MSGIGKTILGGRMHLQVYLQVKVFLMNKQKRIKQNPVALRGYLTQYYQEKFKSMGDNFLNAETDRRKQKK